VHAQQQCQRVSELWLGRVGGCLGAGAERPACPSTVAAGSASSPGTPALACPELSIASKQSPGGTEASQ